MTLSAAAIFFDLDDTLIDDRRATRSGVERLLLRFPAEDIDAEHATSCWTAAIERHFPRFLTGELTLDGVRTVRMRDWASQLDLPLAEGAELDHIDDFLAGYGSGWCAFDDAGPTLARLGGYHLGVITNGHGPQQEAKLDATGLRGWFDIVVTSTDVGMAKPDPEIFLYAADRLDMPPWACVHVGDSRSSDVAGAAGAGFTGVWLDRSGQRGQDDPEPRITSLTELPPLLAPWD